MVANSIYPTTLEAEAEAEAQGGREAEREAERQRGCLLGREGAGDE